MVGQWFKGGTVASVRVAVAIVIIVAGVAFAILIQIILPGVRYERAVIILIEDIVVIVVQIDAVGIAIAIAVGEPVVHEFVTIVVFSIAHFGDGDLRVTKSPTLDSLAGLRPGAGPKLVDHVT